MLATSTHPSTSLSLSVCHIYISSLAFILQLSAHTFFVFGYKRLQRCCCWAIAYFNHLSACYCVLTYALLDTYYCCLHSITQRCPVKLSLEVRGFVGGWKADDRYREESNRWKDGHVTSYCMFKWLRGRSHHNRLQLLVVSSTWGSLLIISTCYYVQQTCRLTFFRWLALAAQPSIFSF